MDDIKISSNRSFGIVFFVIFLLISVYPLLYNENIRIWSLIISITFLFLGIINSRILTPFNHIWFKFGLVLGRFISPLIMGLVFFLVVTPIGLLMRVFKKDLLNLRFDKTDTYWINKQEPKSKMKDQF